MPQKHVLLAFGTRPEVIKLATLAHTLRAWPTPVRVTLCATGQHREMLDSALAAFDLKADIDLKVMTAGQHPTELLARLLTGLKNTFDETKPDVVVVQGDTATVMAAALAGFFARIPVAHVEAGLRTADKFAPFPEEVNRRVTGVVADYHFAPTATARDALIREGTPAAGVMVTGNSVIDALRWMSDRVADRPLPEALRGMRGRMVLITAHRRESFGEPFRDFCNALRDIATRFPDVHLVYPVHLNPNVQKPVFEILGGLPGVHLIDPLPYDSFVSLLRRADIILTDSGGIQEEAPSLGKPTLVLREKTERPEALATGVVKLVGTNRQRIVDEISRLLTDPAAYQSMARVVNVYGDGLASRRIAEVLVDGQRRTPEFVPDAIA